MLLPSSLLLSTTTISPFVTSITAAFFNAITIIDYEAHILDFIKFHLRNELFKQSEFVVCRRNGVREEVGCKSWSRLCHKVEGSEVLEIIPPLLFFSVPDGIAQNRAKEDARVNFENKSLCINKESERF
ncbi:hypothetical protein L2E82_10162 [Cichorium intybus]|uniref:Uncharacterized protein n=1 Tax=Cichorium intybus TaxID=13427 RepID=A0ACB9GB02_CICIN|nr:hypothetical protein L2E82_10162 [Cichorium intybus]